MDYLTALQDKQDKNYREFLRRIIPEGLPPMGVRMADVRATVRTLPSHDLLDEIEGDSWYEQRLLRFLSVNRMKMSENERRDFIGRLLPYLDSWAVTDSFVASLKCVKRDNEAYFSFITSYAVAEHPYTRRFVLVMILSYFHDETFLSRALSLLESVPCSEYTTQMAKAWAIVSLMTKKKEEVIHWYRIEKVGKEVHRMVKQKIRDATALDSTIASRLG
ncbi:MAG: DNA alkylation repair protein [Sphaerochaetaceae bacterium]|nr:DNA alkylation repair protein [Sphaerochaetaceae bacterium]